jgi:hypothetical protein
MTLPIMLFDEAKLKPAFGYVFEQTWVYPYESIVSLLWKFARQNQLPGHLIATQAAKNITDPYEGIEACAKKVDISGLAKALGLPSKTIRASVLPESLQRSSSPWLKYCKLCLKDGYHSVVHQLNRVGKCPFHRIDVSDVCPECGGRTPYRLNARLLNTPYRCASCRAQYAWLIPSPLRIVPMSKEARTAFTRVRLGSGARQ